MPSIGTGPGQQRGPVRIAENSTAITVSPRQSSELGVFQWVDNTIGNFTTALRGTYHHIDVHTYLAEAQYRLTRRFDLQALVDPLLRACLATPPSPERWLRRAEIRAP